MIAKKLLGKFEERFIDNENFIHAFQLIQDHFDFDITNSELTKDVANLLSFDQLNFKADLLF